MFLYVRVYFLVIAIFVKQFCSILNTCTYIICMIKREFEEKMFRYMI